MNAYTTESVADWLGDARAEMSDDQLAEFVRLVQKYEDEIAARRPGYGTEDYFEVDFFDEDNAAWVAAYEIATDQFDLPRRGRDFRDAREALYQGAIVATLSGVSENAAAAAAGLNRITLRKALGK